MRQRGDLGGAFYGATIALIALGFFDGAFELIGLDGFHLLFSTLGLFALVPVGALCVLLPMSRAFKTLMETHPYKLNVGLLIGAVAGFLQIVDYFK